MTAASRPPDDTPPTCTCLSISRDPLCVYHGDRDKVPPVAPDDTLPSAADVLGILKPYRVAPDDTPRPLLQWQQDAADEIHERFGATDYRDTFARVEIARIIMRHYGHA
jgi:hypothetical protein